MFKRDVIFVRHGESVGNTMSQDERALLDIPNHKYQLTPRGHEQARLAGEYLRLFVGQQRNYRIVRAFQSTFVRTQETLGVIMEQLGLRINPITDARLDEKWDGIFHELSKSEIEMSYPEQVRLRKRSGYYHYRAPGGESCPDVELRIRSFIEGELLASNPESSEDTEGCDLIVCHGRWLQVCHKLLRRLTVEEFLYNVKNVEVPNCSVTVYSFNGRLLMECGNPWEGKLEKGNTTFA